MIFKCLILANIFLAFSVIADEELPTFLCKLERTECEFTGVQLNKTHPYWQPTSENVARVNRVTFASSFIPVFTDSLCKAFPKLEEIRLNELSIEEVHENAFNLCLDIRRIYLNRNAIKQLHNGTFSSNNQLEGLYLHENQIEHLSISILSSLPNLVVLDANTNNLKEFSAEILKHNNNLEDLYLETNDLINLDEKKLIEYLPKLKTVGYNNNQFSCVTVERMNNTFAKEGVHIYKTYVPVNRYFEQIKLDDILCAPDAAWTGLYIRSRYDLQTSSIDEKQLQLTDASLLENISYDIVKMNERNEQNDERMTKMEKMIGKILDKLDKIL